MLSNSISVAQHHHTNDISYIFQPYPKSTKVLDVETLLDFYGPKEYTRCGESCTHLSHHVLPPVGHPILLGVSKPVASIPVCEALILHFKKNGGGIEGGGGENALLMPSLVPRPGVLPLMLAAAYNRDTALLQTFVGGDGDDGESKNAGTLTESNDQVSLTLKGLFLYTVGILCNVECCIGKPLSSSITSYSSTSIAYNHHTDIYPLYLLNIST